MKSILNLLALMALTSCATSLLPREQRSIEIIKNTNMSKSEAYNSALTYIATNFGDSNQVIKVKNQIAGTIVLKGNTSCNIFRQTGDANDYLLNFTLTVMTKDKRAKLKYENLYIMGEAGNPTGWAYNQISSAEKVEKSKSCLSSLTNGLFKSSKW